MSVDLLQEKIRKCKNPTVMELAMEKRLIPHSWLQAYDSVADAWRAYCRELLAALRDTVPAVRLSMGGCALFGASGMQALEDVMAYAKELEYYVILDAAELLSPEAAQNLADAWKERPDWDAMVVSPWLGSDVLKPFAALCREGKAVFAVARSANKSAFELQDLLTGSRHVHVAAMDLVQRHGEFALGKFGYSHMGALVGPSASLLKSLRGKYGRIFLLVDGVTDTHGNFKNCSLAFDKFGRGAVAGAGVSIMAAWAKEGAPEDALEAAEQEAVRIKKNIGRYVTVL